MRRNKLRIYVHFVWATWDRQPLISSSVKDQLYRCIAGEAGQHDCRVLAINGMPDHVHLCVALPSTISVADLMQQTKGVSSQFANTHLFGAEQQFKWQGSYAAFSVSQRNLPQLITYIQNQERHHANSTVIPAFEETYEDIRAGD